MSNLPDPPELSTFHRWNYGGEIPPDVEPEQVSADKIKFGFRLTSENARLEFDNFGVTDVEWTFSRYGVGQPFCVTLGLSIFRAALMEQGEDSISKWLSKSERIKAELYISSTLQTGDLYIEEQSGFLDDAEYDLTADTIKIHCRDLSALLWESPQFGSRMPAPATFELVQALADDIGLKTKGYTADGVDFTTVFQFSGDQRRLIGNVGSVGEKPKALLMTGQRGWDMIQTCAKIDDAQVFVFKNTLWYGPHDFFRAGAGKTILTWKKNIVSLSHKHSIYQCGNFAVVMAIVNTLAPTPPNDGEPGEDGGSSSGGGGIGTIPGVGSGDVSTYYYVMTDLRTGPVGISNLLDVRDLLVNRPVYYVTRYNPGGPDDLLSVFNEVIQMFRDVASKEHVIDICISGLYSITPLERIILRGYPDPALENLEITPDSITNQFSCHGGWTTRICSTIHVEPAQPGQLVSEEEMIDNRTPMIIEGEQEPDPGPYPVPSPLPGPDNWDGSGD